MPGRPAFGRLEEIFPFPVSSRVPSPMNSAKGSNSFHVAEGEACHPLGRKGAEDARTSASKGSPAAGAPKR